MTYFFNISNNGLYSIYGVVHLQNINFCLVSYLRFLNGIGRYRRRNVKELHKTLQHVNKDLQKLSHVNKKALDQYINFTEQREELQKRQGELNAGDEV